MGESILEKREETKRIKDGLKESIKESPLEEIAITLAEEVVKERDLTFEERKKALTVIRNWIKFTKDNNVSLGEDDLRSLRYYFSKFCAEQFGSKEKQKIIPKIEDVSHLVMPDNSNYLDYVNSLVGYKISDNKKVAVYGGVARTGLKLLVISRGGDINILENEIPVSDVDVIVENGELKNISSLGANLSGTRVVSDLDSDITDVMTNTDCVFNQAILRAGKLYYTNGAYDDSKTGQINFSGKEDVLFGSEVEKTEDGDLYINRSGFYRAFNFLIRGKAKSLSVNKENLERELKSLVNYFSVLLFVKILPTKSKEKRIFYISRWFNLAKNIGLTETNSPESFLQELFVKSEAFRRHLQENKNQDEKDPQDEIRWMVTKIIDRTFDSMKEEKLKPAFYSKEKIIIDESFLDGQIFDLDRFMNSLNTLRKQ